MTILVGIPTYDDKVISGLAAALMGELAQPECPPYTVAFKQASLLAFGHNALLVIALNNRPAITHLLLVHSDVVPEAGFIKQMLSDMEEAKADLLGAILPIKDSKGLTSTALLTDSHEIDQLGRRDCRRRRLTIKESARLPDVFDCADLQKFFDDHSTKPALLVNTGLLLIDVRKPWVEKCHFEINDDIFKNDDGLYYADVEPEDWHFARQAAGQGARVCVTRRIKAQHIGRQNYPNGGGWGKWEHDENQTPLTVGAPAPVTSVIKQNGDGQHENTLSESLHEPRAPVGV